jgi:hypothetical protein
LVFNRQLVLDLNTKGLAVKFKLREEG